MLLINAVTLCGHVLEIENENRFILSVPRKRTKKSICDNFLVISHEPLKGMTVGCTAGVHGRIENLDDDNQCAIIADRVTFNIHDKFIDVYEKRC